MSRILSGSIVRNGQRPYSDTATEHLIDLTMRLPSVASDSSLEACGTEVSFRWSCEETILAGRDVPPWFDVSAQSRGEGMPYLFGTRVQVVRHFWKDVFLPLRSTTDSGLGVKEMLGDLGSPEIIV